MAGKAIGEFSLKAITATYSPGPAGGVLNQVNWEGTATGFGAAAGRATASPPDAGTSAPGGLRTVGIPVGKVGARLHQAHRRHHRGIEERRRSGHLGWSSLPA